MSVAPRPSDRMVNAVYIALGWEELEVTADESLLRLSQRPVIDYA
jgi:hypothetical protein